VTVASRTGPGVALFGVMLAAVLVPLNSTMIAVALPEIASDLDVSKGSTGLLVVVYLVVMLVGQPASGRLVIGLIGVGATSLAATFVGSFPALVAARLGQAVFAAMLAPSVQSILRRSTTTATRGRSFGLLGSMIGAGAALGPLIGGVVQAVAGWPAVFFVNIPVVAVVLVLQRHGLEQVADAEEETPTPEVADGRIFNRVFTAAWVAQAGTSYGQYSLILVVPLVLDDRGWGPGEIGLAVSALTVGLVVVGPLGGRVGDHHGRRRPSVIGLTSAFVAVAVTAVAGAGMHAALMIAGLALFGFGYGFAAPSMMTAAIESVAERRSGAASGVFATSRYSGSIPASAAFAAATGSGTTGVDELLIAAAVFGAVAVAATVALPSRPGPPDATEA